MAKRSPKKDALDAIGIASICERIADCVTLQAIADDAGVSKGTLINWLAQESHVDQYARAREAQADKMAEDILAIADDSSKDVYVDENGNVRTDQEVVARSKLRIDARKWLAGKMAPKKYGDKLDIDNKVSGEIKVERIERVIIDPK